jgi:histidine ammonia-lyase
MPDLSPTQPLTLASLADLLRTKDAVRLGPDAEQRVAAGHAYLRQRLAPAASPDAVSNHDFFARLPDAGLPPELQTQWQANLLMSHAAGTCPEVPTTLVRRMLLLKAQSLSQGHHGVAPATVRRLLDFYNRDVWPVVYEQGSLGAYGDQAPLAHLSLPLLGLGEVNYQGYRLAAADVLSLFGWEPLPLQAQEGLALLGGNQFMLAYTTEAVERANHLLRAADVISALSSDVFGASAEPLHEALHRVRVHAGPIQVAARLRQLLEGSGLPNLDWAQAVPPEHDPQAFRCVPQVHGASRDALAYVGLVVETECNAVTGRALIFPEENLLLHGTSLPGQPLALVLDHLAIALSGLGSLSERRTACLVAGQRQLPLYLAADAALNFGLLSLPNSAASLVSQNKQLCSPSSMTESGTGDHTGGPLSSGATAAAEARRVVENVEQILGIELLAAAQALDFRRPARTSPALEAVVAAFREVVTFVPHDRVLAPDLHRAARFVREYDWA